MSAWLWFAIAAGVAAVVTIVIAWAACAVAGRADRRRQT